MPPGNQTVWTFVGILVILALLIWLVPRLARLG